MKLPKEHKWSQLNQGDIFSALHSTMAATFDSLGKAQFSKKTFAIFSSDTNSNFDYPLAINYYNGNYVVLTSDEIFEGSIDGDDFTEISGTPTLSTGSDALVIFGLYHVTTNNNLSSWDNSSWVNNLASLTGGVPHPMESFDSLSTYKLAIGNGNKVGLYDSSYNKSTSELILPEEQQVTTVRYRNGYLYVGTKHLNGGDAKVYIWNGDGNAAQYEAPTGASWVFSMTDYGTTVAAVTSQGQIGEVLGGTFKEIAAFPVYYAPDKRWQGSGGYVNGKVMNRGMATVGKRIYIVIEGEVDSGFMPEMRGGLWVFDPNIGLYHRATLSSTRFKKKAVTTSNNVFTVTEDHDLKDGDGVQFSAGSGITGITDGVIYYVKVTGADTFKLARSRHSLMNEEYMEVSGNSLSTNLIFVPNNDVGDQYFNGPGAVAKTVYNETPLKLWESEVIFGSRVQNINGTPGPYVLNGFTPSLNVGQLEFQRLYGQSIQDAWDKLHSYLDGIDLDNEELIVKFRKDEKIETPLMDAIWVNENQIRSVLASRVADPWEDISNGDEVVLIEGIGRGYSAHVTHIDVSAKTFTLTLDESIGEANTSLRFYATNYKKTDSYNKQNKADGLIKASIDASGSWGQIKIEHRGFESAIAINDIGAKTHE